MVEGDPHDGGTGELLLTIRDASRATGLSIKALRRRVERGTLPARMIEGRRRVPMSELLRAGLLVTGPGERQAPHGPPSEAVSVLARRVAALESRVTALEAAGAEPAAGHPVRA
jgi:hypothetical protein